MFEAKPLRVTFANDKIRFRRIHKLVNSQEFEFLIMACIALNSIVLALKWYNQHEYFEIGAEYANYVFQGIFTLEAILKILGLGPRQYFRNYWNIFDFLVVFGTYVGIIVGTFSNLQVGSQATVMRAFRIMRIFRLMKKAKKMKVVINTFVLSIPSIMNVGGLLMLMVYLYAVLGMFLFAFHKTEQGFGISEWANF